MLPKSKILTDIEIGEAINPVYVNVPPKRKNRDGGDTWAFQIADKVSIAILDKADAHYQSEHQKVVRDLVARLRKYRLITPKDNSLTQFEPFRAIPESEINFIEAKYL